MYLSRFLLHLFFPTMSRCRPSRCDLEHRQSAFSYNFQFLTRKIMKSIFLFIFLLFASGFLYEYQAGVSATASSAGEVINVAFGIAHCSTYSLNLRRLGQTRGGGADDEFAASGSRTSTRFSSNLSPDEENNQGDSWQQWQQASWSEIYSSVQDKLLDKENFFTSIFHRTKDDILESVSRKRTQQHDDVPPDNGDDCHLTIPHDNVSEKQDQIMSTFFDRISTSIALVVVCCTNLQALGKLAPSAYRSNLIEEVAVKVLSPETYSAVKRIRSIINQLEPEYGVVDVFSRYPPKDLVASVVALSRLQHASDYYETMILQQQQKKAYKKQLFVTPENNPELLSDLAHYSVFANVAYGWKGSIAVSGRFRVGNVQTLIQRTGMKEEDMIHAQWSSATHRPAFFIVRDTDRKNIVLSIRGTLSPKDILTDLCATAESFDAEELNRDKKRSLFGRIFGNAKGVSSESNARTTAPFRAHHGMIQGAREISHIAREIVTKELESNPDFSLVLVGHSLGGGTAAVLGAMWKSLFPNLAVYAYGCPCVFPLDMDAQFYSNIISIVGMHDPFSTLSLGHLADISKALSQLCEDEDRRAEVISRCANRAQDMSEEDLLWASELMNILREKMTSEKLYPPGRILLITGPTQNGNDGKVQVEEVKPKRFKEIMLHPRIFDLSRHVPNRYEDELRELWQNCSKI